MPQHHWQGLKRLLRPPGNLHHPGIVHHFKQNGCAKSARWRLHRTVSCSQAVRGNARQQHRRLQHLIQRSQRQSWSISETFRCFKQCCFLPAGSGLHQPCDGKRRGLVNPSCVWKDFSCCREQTPEPFSVYSSEYELDRLREHTERESLGPNTEAIITPTFLEYGYFQIKSAFWNVNVTGHS